MVSTEYKPLQRCFEKYQWEGFEDNEQLFHNINVRQKDNMYLYNYNDNALVSRNHPVIVKCRGLVVNVDGTILGYPFDRFFNYFELECPTNFDWNNAVIQEKVDGTFILVFWNGTDWEVTTRGAFYPLPKGKGDYLDYNKLFRKHFDKFDKLSKDFCYMFELVTKENRIITQYDTECVYLLGVRNIKTLCELPYDLLDCSAEEINVKRPKYYNVNNLSECIKLFDKFRDDEEGLVALSKYASSPKFICCNKIKIKQDSYIRLVRIKQLKPQCIFEYILGKTSIDEELLVKLPEVQDEINKMCKIWDEKKALLLNTFDKIKDNPIRKDFALCAKKYKYQGCLFSLYDGNKPWEHNLRWEKVLEW